MRAVNILNGLRDLIAEVDMPPRIQEVAFLNDESVIALGASDTRFFGAIEAKFLQIECGAVGDGDGTPCRLYYESDAIPFDPEYAFSGYSGQWSEVIEKCDALFSKKSKKNNSDSTPN